MNHIIQLLSHRILAIQFYIGRANNRFILVLECQNLSLKLSKSTMKSISLYHHADFKIFQIVQVKRVHTLFEANFLTVSKKNLNFSIFVLPNRNLQQYFIKRQRKIDRQSQKTKMNQKGLQLEHDHEQMDFQPSLNQPIAYTNFTAFLPYNSTYGQDKVKYQYKNQSSYNISDRKNLIYHHHQMSPQYDLFEIQKKRKKQKYKRSTNNSHKKFISALRRLFYAVISTTEKEEFQIKYSKFRSCRTFFFIILAYMKFRFSPKLLNSVRVSFINQMKIKINQYQEEITRTKNMNLKNFREEEIIDIKYSIKSCNEYFIGNTRQAIECMYKKDKSTVIKRQHYQSALRSVHLIEKELNENPRSPLQSPYIEDFSHSSERQKVQRKVIKRQIRQHQLQKFALEKQEPFDFGYSFNHISDPYVRPKKDVRITAATENQGNHDNESGQSASQKQFTNQRKILFPPLLQEIPYIPYDPFLPPFRYKRETKYRIDVREDFFGPMNFGFPKFYQKRTSPYRINSPNFFSNQFPPRI